VVPIERPGIEDPITEIDSRPGTSGSKFERVLPSSAGEEGKDASVAKTSAYNSHFRPTTAGSHFRPFTAGSHFRPTTAGSVDSRPLTRGTVQTRLSYLARLKAGKILEEAQESDDESDEEAELKVSK
jgi:hypothetical protein